MHSVTRGPPGLLSSRVMSIFAITSHQYTLYTPGHLKILWDIFAKKSPHMSFCNSFITISSRYVYFINVTSSDYQSLRPSIKKHSQDESPRHSSRRSVSEDREDSVLSDSFSMLSMSNSNIPHHLTNRMSQYSPQ